MNEQVCCCTAINGITTKGYCMQATYQFGFAFCLPTGAVKSFNLRQRSSHAQKPSISEPPNVSCLTRRDPCWIWPKQFRRVACVHLFKSSISDKFTEVDIHRYHTHLAWKGTYLQERFETCWMFTCWSTLQQTNKRKIKFRNSFFYHLPLDESFISPKNTWHGFQGDFSLKVDEKLPVLNKSPTSSTWGCKVTIPAVHLRLLENQPAGFHLVMDKNPQWNCFLLTVVY